MNKSAKQTQPALGDEVRTGVSPEATGGAGTIDEYRLAVVALVALLRGDALAGLSRPVAAVGLQRREAGNLLDDIVLQTSVEHSAVRIEYQVKRAMSPTKSNAAFCDSVRQCLEAIEADREAIVEGRLRLGLATDPSGPIDQLAKLSDLARGHATLESFTSILKPGVVDKKVRERRDAVEQTVVKVQRDRGRLLLTSDYPSLTFLLLKATHIWQFEVGAGGRDTINATNRLADILPDGQPPADAYAAIAELAQVWGPQAGLISPGMLRSALEQRGVALTVEPKQQAVWSKLLAATEAELDATSWEIGHRLALPRTAALERVTDAIRDNSLVLIEGPAGGGKSVLARHAVKDLRQTATVVVVDLAGRGQDTLADLTAELGADLATALPAAATTGPRILLIDGAEHALVDAGRLLRAVIRTVPLAPGPAPQWTLVLTARSDAAAAVRGQLPAAPVTVEIGDLEEAEVAEIVREFPELIPLTRNNRSGRLLRRPYLVDLLVRSGVRLEDRPLGEEDVLDLVWEQVVRRQEGGRPGLGSPHARAGACLGVAEESARTGKSSLLQQFDGDAVRGLESDEILVRDRTRYRFAHDILLDYALAIRLLDGDPAELISQAEEARRLIRAVRLMLQRQLSDSINRQNAPQTWADLVQFSHEIAAENGSRWQDLPFEALLAMGNPRLLLGRLQSALLADDGEQLFQLLVVLRRFGTISALEPGSERLQLDVVLAAPLVDFLSVLGQQVPQRVTAMAADVVHRWLLAAARSGVRVEDYVQDAEALARAVAWWSGSDLYGDRLESVLPALALLGRHITTEGQAVFDRLSERNHELQGVVEDPDTAAANPDLLLLLAGRYYINQSLTLASADTTPAEQGSRRRRGFSLSSLHRHHDDVRDHAPRFRRTDNAGLAAPHYGPFSSLLEVSPSHGLRLIGAVVDAASRSRTAVEQSFEGGDSTFTLELRRTDWQDPVVYTGTTTTWGWFQRSGNGAYPGMSALMALAEWSVAEASKRPLDEVVDQVLHTSSCPGVIPIAISLFVERLEEITDQLDVFLEQPAVWDLENARRAQGVLSYPLRGFRRLDWDLPRVVLALVGTSDGTGQARLRAVGDRLVQRTRDELAKFLGAPPPEDHQLLLVAEGRARRFDRDSYTVSTTDGGRIAEIAVELPEHVERGLRQDGRRAVLNLTVASLTLRAVRIRDGENSEDAQVVWEQMREALSELEQLDEDRIGAVYSPTEARAAAAAALIITNGHDNRLAGAVTTLLDAVEKPTAPAAGSLPEDRDSVSPVGPDRSAATALPHVLSTANLLVESEEFVPRIEAVIRQLAGSELAEVRRRLARGFDAALTAPCGDAASTHLHDVAINTLNELLLQSDMGPWEDSRRQRVRLSDPLKVALAPGADVLMIDSASDTLPSLAKAVHLPCQHGTAAKDLLRTLVNYDLTIWPEHYARRHYAGIDEWRSGIDQHVAELVISGDHGLLVEYLDRFTPVAEQLSDLLNKLTELAVTAERASLLFRTYWPQLLDRLLPGNRNLDNNSAGRRGHPRSDDVHALDRALLPIPEPRSPWPAQSLGLILVRWTHALSARPQVADHAIKAVQAYGLIRSTEGTSLILDVLGTNVELIRRYSQTATTWLNFALIHERTAASNVQRSRMLEMVDRLSEVGDATAVELQRQLELQ